MCVRADTRGRECRGQDQGRDVDASDRTRIWMNERRADRGQLVIASSALCGIYGMAGAAVEPGGGRKTGCLFLI